MCPFTGLSGPFFHYLARMLLFSRTSPLARLKSPKTNMLAERLFEKSLSISDETTSETGQKEEDGDQKRKKKEDTE